MRWLILIVFALLFSCKKGKNNPDACNGSSTRREIKLCVDNKASLIDTTVIPISIDSIGSLSVVEAKKKTERQPVEMHVYRVTGTVDKVKKYRDGDYHIMLKDQNDHYVICEVPNSGCDYASNSPFISQFKFIGEKVKQDFDKLLGMEVTITGVGFIDINHHYHRKQASNNVEIHPILDISY